jgi:hypothetical protein
MATTVDHQLGFGMLGRLGTLWSRHADADTRGKARAVAEVASGGMRVRNLDEIAGWAANSGDALMHDTHIRFADGDFAILGYNLRDYVHDGTFSSGGQTGWSLHRPDMSVWDVSAEPVPSQLADAIDWLQSSQAEIGTLTVAATLWYLIPVPDGITPLLIRGKAGQTLVSGIDFFAFRGYIAMRKTPAETLPSGLVHVPLASKTLAESGSYWLSAAPDRRCSRYLNAYARQSQSLVTFRRAAAEYCGLYVLQNPDFVLGTKTSAGGATIYALANAGAVIIDYPHSPLRVGAFYPAGHVVAGHFEFWNAEYSSRSFADVVSDTSTPISMDGVLPVKGLSWEPWQPLPISFETNPGGDPRVMLEFEGDPADLQRLHGLQRMRETQTGASLLDAMDLVGNETGIDFAQTLLNFYGNALVLVIFHGGSESMQKKLAEFISANKPANCVVISQFNQNFSFDYVDLPPSVLLDANMLPVLDALGGFILTR